MRTTGIFLMGWLILSVVALAWGTVASAIFNLAWSWPWEWDQIGRVQIILWCMVLAPGWSAGYTIFNIRCGK